MLIRSQTLIYGRDTLGIRRVRSEYADIRRFTYRVIRRDQIIFWTCSKFISVCERIYVTHTLTIRTAYAGYARHTLDIHLIH